MTMTIKVYEVDRYGQTRIRRPTTEIAPVEVVEENFVCPPCQCPKCKAQQP
ncbi:hypothetical protein [Streptomyces atratus]|uniref:hypothetical protein n=1 Tax=Streptomyces atratus TaxID=1893 RepID=UPI00365520FD